MKHRVMQTTGLLIALLVVVLLVWASAVDAQSSQSPVIDPQYHRIQATHYRQEAARLQNVIERYQMMMMAYSMGSDSATSTINPQGRRAMVERTIRTIVYFRQQQAESEQRATEHETIAQMLPERSHNHENSASERTPLGMRYGLY